jgi:hypothetical protein
MTASQAEILTREIRTRDLDDPNSKARPGVPGPARSITVAS